MFFEKHNAAISVVDVLCFETGKMNISHNAGREYHAVSFRKKADTVLSYGERNRETEVSLSDKSIVFVPAQLPYVRKAQKEEMIVIHFLADGEQTQDIKLFLPKNADTFEKLFDEIYRVWKNKDAGYRLKAGELLFQILYMITTEEQEEQGCGSMSSRAARMIKKNAENVNFSVSQLAPALNISGAYLRRLFKEEYHMTPKEYLTLCRLEIAKSLLNTGYFTVSEVAGRSGFENEKYFSTVFKKYCGVPPKKYS